MKISLNGRSGKVGSVLAPALEAAGHQLVDLEAAEAMVDFTAPDAVEGNLRAAAERGIPSVIGTSGFDQGPVDAIAREHGVACFYGPNFAIGAVLMMRFAKQASEYMPDLEIIEMHEQGKKDAPSGTAKATAALLGSDPPIHSVRLPGLVAHQEVVFGGDGQLLTIRHDTFSREAFVPGVLIALEKLHTLPPGLTVGLDAIL
jgi:4-hydroxy-tetrahydrodipicolinate reductase